MNLDRDNYLCLSDVCPYPKFKGLPFDPLKPPKDEIAHTLGATALGRRLIADPCVLEASPVNAQGPSHETMRSVWSPCAWRGTMNVSATTTATEIALTDPRLGCILMGWRHTPCTTPSVRGWSLHTRHCTVLEFDELCNTQIMYHMLIRHDRRGMQAGSGPFGLGP